MLRCISSFIAVVISFAGCSEAPPSAGPLGALPADPQAAEQFRKDAEIRVLRETAPLEIELRERAEHVKSQISSRGLVVEHSWEPPEAEGQEPVCRVDVRGRLNMPTDYGRRGATCSCVIMIERQGPSPDARPRAVAGSATMARYLGAGEGTFQAVIRVQRCQPGRYVAILRINQRDVDATEFEIAPAS